MKEEKEEDVAVISNVLLHASSSYQLSLILITIIFMFVELAVGQPAFIGHVEGHSCMISPFFPIMLVIGLSLVQRAELALAIA